jgi:hypothetical protein
VHEAPEQTGVGFAITASAEGIVLATTGIETNNPAINAPTTHLLTRVWRGEFRLNMAPAQCNDSEPIV